MREEQNFISANEIDNMVLIMPTATRRLTVVSDATPGATVGKVYFLNMLRNDTLDTVSILRIVSISFLLHFRKRRKIGIRKETRIKKCKLA